MSVTEIRVAHSPDSDDAFMFYALASGKLDTGGLRFTDILADIETLNRRALVGEYEVTAVSIHAYAYISSRYALLSSGASMGERYGPMVVSRTPHAIDDLRGLEIAVPGMMTSAYLALRLAVPDAVCTAMPFDRILEAVESGQVPAGLLIHEGQLTYASRGLHKCLDLGEWWHARTGLPLPLGGNAIRRDLGADRIARIAGLIKASIRYALDNRSEALLHAMRYARDLNADQADRFVGMYVNSRTLDYGEDGRRAVQLLLDEAFDAGILPSRTVVEFV